MKVCIIPYFDKPDDADGGIRRVVKAQIKYLPEFGIETTKDPREADVIATHGTVLVNFPGIPSVNHSHGLYWSRFPWGHGIQETNADGIEAMRRAVAHTACSKWVATSLRRGMLVYPEVIYHGVDAEEWEHEEETQPYILWNKARADYVSNPADMQEVAKRLPHRQFVTTIGTPTENVKVIGKMPYQEMKKYIQRASLLLNTPRETMGIGPLEALAAGVPVISWSWGGCAESILNGTTGYLAPPGDYDALADCIEHGFANRERLSKRAVEDVHERWRWRDKILQYANIYKRVYKYLSSSPPTTWTNTCPTAWIPSLIRPLKISSAL
jgi:glycosyltransferase involved in cell wall biosynthesis